MKTSLAISKDKLVPTEAIRDLTRGSFEHLSLRLDDVIAENATMFTQDKTVSVARIATFSDRAIVGTSEGKYFNIRYEDRDGDIRLYTPDSLDVEVVDISNVNEYVNTFAMSVVDSLLTGSPEKRREGIIALAGLKESVDSEFDTDLATVIRNIISSPSAWRKVYKEQAETIKNQVADVLESIKAKEVEAKYVPLYDGTIPEEKFHLYRESATRDLSSITARLAKTGEKVESVYLPFSESLAKMKNVAADEKAVLQQFVAFSESLSQEVNQLCEQARFALEHEQCVMCLGQVHDAIAEALTDYEIAGSFIERIATRFMETA